MSTTAEIAYIVCIVSFFIAGSIAVYLLWLKVQAQNKPVTRKPAAKKVRPAVKKPATKKTVKPAVAKKAPAKKPVAKRTTRTRK